MKLKKQFITHDIDDTQMMVNSSNKENEFHGLVKSNESAAFIINLLKEEKTKEDLVKALLDEYEIDENTAKESIEYVIDRLNSINALE